MRAKVRLPDGRVAIVRLPESGGPPSQPTQAEADFQQKFAQQFQREPRLQNLALPGETQQTLAQQAMLANIPFVGDKSAPRRLDVEEAERRQRIGAPEAPIQPSTAAAMSTQGILSAPAGALVAPAKTGTVLESLKNVGKMAGVGAAEGAVFGAGTTEGDKMDAALRQGGIGAAFPVAAKTLEAGVKLAGSGSKALGRLLGDVDAVDLTPQDINNLSEDIIVSTLKKYGMTPELAAIEAKRLKGGETTMADVLESPGRKLLGAASTAEEGLPESLKTQFKVRDDEASRRILEDMPGALKVSPSRAVDYEDRLTESVQFIRDEYYTGDLMDTTLRNQEALNEFLSRPNTRNLLRKAADEVETVTGTRPKYTEAEGILEGGGGDAAPIIDIRIADMISDMLSDGISANNLKAMTKKSVRKDNLRKEWLKLVEENDPTGRYAEARGFYADAMAQKRAYEAGVQNFANMPKSDVNAYLKTLSEPEKEAFKLGAARTIFDAEDTGILGNVSNANVQDKLDGVFGSGTAEKMRNLSERESVYKSTKDAVVKGVDRELGTSVDELMSGGKSQGLPVLAKRRAYSTTGLQFATADAILEAMQASKLPDSVKAHIAKKLRSSDNLEDTIRKMFDSKDARDKAAISTFLDWQQRKGAATVGTGGAVGALLGGKD